MNTGTSISYDVAGTTMIGYLARPIQTVGCASSPAVLVCHEGPGLDEIAKTKADRLTALGYVAFALDYQGGGKRLPDMATVMARLGPLMGNSEAIRALGTAGLRVLLAQPEVDPSRVAAIGYCFGGTMVLELARAGTDLRAVVGFHSGLGTSRPDDASNIKSVVLVCIGTEDPIIPADQRIAFEAEMRAGHVDWRMNLYGGAAHSFTNPIADQAGIPGIEYHEQTDIRSWRAMLDLFAEVGM